MQGRNQGNYRNPCLTMHQPWASLLIYGIKRVEGRSWPSPIRGRLWIHAASKVPDESTIKAMEQFYREIYAVNGVTDIKFPQHYPVSRLIGCVEVVGCVRGEELSCWDAVPEGVRLEALTEFCWLCEQPKRLVIPFEMRGFQRVYNLEKKIYEAAVRGLTPVESPLPVKFPLPNPRDPFSLKPGSLTLQFSESQMTELEKPPSLSAAITGARAAATQFSSKNQYHSGSYSTRTSTMQSNALQEVETASSNSVEVSDGITLEDNKKDFCDHYQPSQRKPRRNEWATSTSNASLEVGTASSNLVKVSDDMTLQNNEKGFYEHNQPSQRNPRHNEQATSKIFAEAIRGLKRS